MTSFLIGDCSLGSRIIISLMPGVGLDNFMVMVSKSLGRLKMLVCPILILNDSIFLNF